VCALYHLMVRVAQSSSQFVRVTVDLRRRGGMWRSSVPPRHMSVLLTDSRIKGGIDLTWDAGSACLKEAGRRQ